MHGYQTFSSGIGEWFLGAIIILYAIYPIFRILLIKCPKTFLVLSLIIYLLVAYNYNKETPHFSANLVLKGGEFIIGMYFGRYCKKFPKFLLTISLPVILLLTFSRMIIPVNQSVKVTLFSCAVWISISYLEKYSIMFNDKCITKLSNLTYELFLTHHIVIYQLTHFAAKYIHQTSDVLIFLTIEILAIILLALILRLIIQKLYVHLR